MRLTLITIFALIIFFISWFINAALIAGLAYLATSAGVKSGIFLDINVLLTWIIAPGLGSGVAIYAVGKKFSNTDINLVFVSFISVIVMLLIVIFISNIFLQNTDIYSFWNLLIFFSQSISIIVGARIGRNLIKC